ncbi:hypothetical protein GX50_03624 [[Emmonsia] crescens]|uniref:superoxide dismutase n=1 Tax=[Emmonsia] crescens TaxID=73230 RepID=A0A2B7ZKN3_9EURO|nr:hypothetical protein GX50_03624 [Emmonsia crescens]
MRSTFAILACSALSFGLSMAQYISAPVTENNPRGVVYAATLLNKTTSTVRGTINATAGPGGRGVVFNVDFFDFPDEKEFGPFLYHIHDQPVPADGNCSGTLAHLDPFKRGEKPPCDKSRPDTCQVGDLGGKYGDIMDVANGKHFKATYLDFYTSTRHGPGAFFGNRSIVVHYHNTTRINCANFTLVSNQTTPYPTGGQPRPTQTPPPLEAAASRVGALSAGVIIASVAALMW